MTGSRSSNHLRDGEGVLEEAEAGPVLMGPCSFCWFILELYPTMKGMSDYDKMCFRTHLRIEHGLLPEISP